ncbi:MAG: hypothetical protein Q4D63_07260 [Neisseria animaloris]|nr:hypothetical protein [Neisseria animaloris]
MTAFALTSFELKTGDIVTSNEVESELNRIEPSLSEDLFMEIGLAAHNVLQDKSQFYDKNSIGAAWQAEVTSFLRSQLVARNWMLQDWVGGAYLTLSPCKTKCIIVATGCSSVGREQGFPTTTSRKGRKWEEAVSNLRLDLPDTVQFWVLLIHRTVYGLQMELSLPENLIDGQITGYVKRIILQDVNFGIVANTEITRKRQTPSEVQEPIVERKRKAV